jgi:hypothetical protein
VAESFIRGAEYEAEEEKKDDREVYKNELEFSLSDPPFGVYKIYRYVIQHEHTQ